MVLSKRERYIVIGTVIAIAAFAIDRVLIEPLRDSETVMAGEKEKLQSDIKHGRELVKGKEKAEARWKERVAAGLKADAAETESVLLHAIREWSQDANLSLSSVRPERPVQKKGQWPEVLVQVSGTGSMNAVSRFLWRLQTCPQPVKVVEMTLGARREGQDDLSLQLHLSALYVPAESKSPVAVRPATATGGSHP